MEYIPLEELEFDKNCTSCRLHTARRVYTKTGEKVDPGAIPGCTGKDISRVKLIVISDHPSVNEERVGYPMYSNETDRLTNPKKILLGWQTAGALLRSELKSMYGLNTYTDIYITNAVKCNYREETALENDIKLCAEKWLYRELLILDKYVPSVPILVAGGKAFAAISKIDRETTLHYTKKNIATLRGSSHYFYRKHPLIFTVNPVAVANCVMRLEINAQGTKAMELRPMFGSPLWLFRQDLRLLEKFLNQD